MLETKVIDFTGKLKATGILSAVLLLVAIGSFFVNGIKLGLDFTGGVQIVLGYSEPADLTEVRSVLSEMDYGNNEVVFFGSERDVRIRIQSEAGDELDPEEVGRIGAELMQQLSERNNRQVSLLSSEYVGSVVGEELREQGGLGLLVATFMVLIYIALRFQFKFSLACVAAVVEDVILTLGFISLIQYEFNLAELAALMAVLGYGLNDTIVISDRIRENFRVMRRTDVKTIINISLTQTLNRTLVTSMTTLLVLTALFFMGGEALRGFSLVLIVGVLISIYSSLFVSTGVLMRLHISKEDLMPPVKENEELNAIP